MADAVSSIVVADTTTHHIIHLTNISDGAGEAAVIKVDKSAIAVAADGAEANSLDIEQVRWAIQGFTSVRLLWDHTTDDVAMVLAGSGYEDFRLDADSRGSMTTIPALNDPRSTGGTGDILLTTAGAASGATYDITLFLRKATA
jgi:hypothetical protein